MNYRSAWNLSTLAIGIVLLIVGSFYYQASDWDIPISFIMAGFTYLTAAWSLKVLVERRWRMFPLMLLATWWAVDGCYALYWHFKDPIALELMREANWPAALALYWACGLVWSFDMKRALAKMHALKRGKSEYRYPPQTERVGLSDPTAPDYVGTYDPPPSYEADPAKVHPKP